MLSIYVGNPSLEFAEQKGSSEIDRRSDGVVKRWLDMQGNGVQEWCLLLADNRDTGLRESGYTRPKSYSKRP